MFLVLNKLLYGDDNLTKFVMYTGGLGPYQEVNNKTFPEKIVVEIEDKELPVFFRRRKFIEVKGIQLLKKSTSTEFAAVKNNA